MRTPRQLAAPVVLTALITTGAGIASAPAALADSSGGGGGGFSPSPSPPPSSCTLCTTPPPGGHQHSDFRHQVRRAIHEYIRHLPADQRHRINQILLRHTG